MTYQRVRWRHDLAHEPIVLYAEVNEARVEVRKVDEFADGRLAWADAAHDDGSTVLADQLMPSLSSINDDAEFEAEAIDRETFEAVWRRATSQ